MAIAIVGLVLVVALGDPTMGVRRWLPVLGWNLQITGVVWPLYVANGDSLDALHRAMRCKPCTAAFALPAECSSPYRESGSALGITHARFRALRYEQRTSASAQAELTQGL